MNVSEIIVVENAKMSKSEMNNPFRNKHFHRNHSEAKLTIVRSEYSQILGKSLQFGCPQNR